MNAILQTQQLTIQVANKKICRNLDLTISPGDIWGILGPNGSGKTTFLHTLAGLCNPVSGEIHLQAKPLPQYAKKHLARYLGILLQHTQIMFPQTVFEYCLAGRYPHLSYFHREQSADYLATTQALGAMELDLLQTKNIFTLSGGERRRLAIATLLTQAPQIYLLDEPTNHLDLRHQMKVLHHFKNLAELNSASIIMALHDINLAQQFCNKIILIGEGELLQGYTDDMLTSENLFNLYRHPLRSTMVDDRKIWVSCEI